MSETYIQSLTENYFRNGENMKLTVKLEKRNDNINLSIIRETGTTGTELLEVNSDPSKSVFSNLSRFEAILHDFLLGQPPPNDVVANVGSVYFKMRDMLRRVENWYQLHPHITLRKSHGKIRKNHGKLWIFLKIKKFFTIL